LSYHVHFVCHPLPRHIRFFLFYYYDYRRSVLLFVVLLLAVATGNVCCLVDTLLSTRGVVFLSSFVAVVLESLMDFGLDDDELLLEHGGDFAMGQPALPTPPVEGFGDLDALDPTNEDAFALGGMLCHNHRLWSHQPMISSDAYSILLALSAAAAASSSSSSSVTHA
jgi:hypothetical protein